MDINRNSAILCWNRLDFADVEGVRIFTGDARKLDKIGDEEVDFILAHPPYANVIRYSGNSEDLSNLTVKSFVNEMKTVALENFRVLKKGKYCAILIGDTRKDGMQIPMAYLVLQKFLKAGFILKEDIIKTQWNCSSTGYWKKQSEMYNFHLIMHEHLFVFRKPVGKGT